MAKSVSIELLPNNDYFNRLIDSRFRGNDAIFKVWLDILSIPGKKTLKKKNRFEYI